MPDFYRKKGDLKPDITVQFKDGDGVAINLTGATVVFNARMKGAAARLRDGVATTISDPANGIVKYVLQAGDTDTEGLMLCEFVRTDGGRQSAPQDRHLEVQIGPAV